MIQLFRALLHNWLAKTFNDAPLPSYEVDQTAESAKYASPKRTKQFSSLDDIFTLSSQAVSMGYRA